jgi:hypothetical protein
MARATGRQGQRTGNQARAQNTFLHEFSPAKTGAQFPGRPPYVVDAGTLEDREGGVIATML